MRIVRSAAYATIPWKNGRGVTRRVAVFPAEAGYQALDWHVSRTAIAHDTPFSQLTGLDRQLLLVSGEGVILRLRSETDHVDLERRIDRPLEPFAFRGDWDVDCAVVDGPVEVLNVMTRRGRAAARIDVRAFSAPETLRKPARETLVVFAAGSGLTAYGSWGTASLSADDSIVVDEHEATEIALGHSDSSAARAVLIRLDLV